MPHKPGHNGRMRSNRRRNLTSARPRGATSPLPTPTEGSPSSRLRNMSRTGFAANRSMYRIVETNKNYTGKVVKYGDKLFTTTTGAYEGKMSQEVVSSGNQYANRGRSLRRNQSRANLQSPNQRTSLNLARGRRRDRFTEPQPMRRSRPGRRTTKRGGGSSSGGRGGY